MIEDSPTKSDDSAPATAHGLSFASALLVTTVFIAVAVGGSYGVARSTMSTGTKGTLAIATLLAVVGLFYSIFQLILALVATTGERRWSSRDVSERRGGERARRPPSA